PMECDSNPISADAEHFVLIRLWIVDRFFRIRIAGERYGEPVLHQSCRLLPLGGRDEIHRPDLIAFAPTAPVVEIFFPLLELLACHLAALRSARTRCSHYQNHDD